MPNTPASTKRIESLDFLRGVFIVLALMQHFAGEMNLVGLKPDNIISWLFWTLTPSGDQTFLALAAFNLGKRRREDFKSVYPTKVMFYAALFVFFFFENFYRANDLGAALSWGPLLTWMVVLAFLATIHRIFGWMGVLAIFIGQMFFWLMPFEQWATDFTFSVRSTLGLARFSYESRLDLFLGSGCVGFLLGYYHYHGQVSDRWKQLAAIATGVLLTLPFFVLGEYWALNLAYMWHGEYFVASQFLGALWIWGIEITLISTAVYLEARGIPLRMPIVSWCGRFSFLIFAFHYSFFVRVLFPLRLLMAEIWQFPPRNTFGELMTHVGITLAFCFLLQWSGLLIFMQAQRSPHEATEETKRKVE